MKLQKYSAPIKGQHQQTYFLLIEYNINNNNININKNKSKNKK